VKYQAVIFDLFGTLIDKLSIRGHRSTLRQMASVIAAPPDDFIRLWFDTFNEREIGIFKSLEDNIKYICNKLKLDVEDREIARAAQINIENTARSIKLRPYAAELLAYLKAEGYKTGLITNCSPEIPRIFNKMPIARFFDAALFSGLEGKAKPNPHMYQATIERLAVKSEDCLYIGDGDSNELTGALEAGMHPVLIRNTDEDRTDVHRVDYEGDNWQGPVITSLQEVMNLLK